MAKNHENIGSFGFFKASLFLFFSVFCAISLPAWSGEKIVVGGTGGALAGIKLLAADFQRMHPGLKIIVLPSLGSSGGIKAVLAGAVDIGVSGRALENSEQGVVAREYARTPFVFAVSKTMQVSGLTIRQITSIYSGNTRTWPDGRRIRVVLRPAAEYDTALLKSMSQDMNRAVENGLSNKGTIVEVTDQENAHAIEKVPGALGTITLAQLICEKRSLKALALNDIRPSSQTVADGTYPYVKRYYLVMKRNLRQNVREFVDFVYSDQGRKILTQSGYQVISFLHAQSR